jgi:hypothetical protein
MSENEGGDSRFMTGFLVGFVVAVLICLGVGGSFLLVGVSHRNAAAEEAMMAEREARERAMQARQQAEVERARAEKALRDTKAAQAAKEQPGGKKEGPP